MGTGQGFNTEVGSSQKLGKNKMEISTEAVTVTVAIVSWALTGPAVGKLLYLTASLCSFGQSFSTVWCGHFRLGPSGLWGLPVLCKVAAPLASAH